MKFLITWSWACENSKAVHERFAKWKPTADTKFLFPVHVILGQNWAFTITESDNIEQMVKNIDPWTDICTFEISPTIDARELGKLRG